MGVWGKEIRAKLLTLENLSSRPTAQKLPRDYVMLFLENDNIVYGNDQENQATILDTRNIVTLNNITPVVAIFDSTGKIEIEIEDANLYGCVGAMQADPNGLQSTYRRINPSNTDAIEIQADAGEGAEDIIFFGFIALIPS